MKTRVSLCYGKLSYASACHLPALTFPRQWPYAFHMAAKASGVPFRFAALLIGGSLLAPAVAKNVEKPMLSDKYVHVNGVRLHVVTAGKGSLILFLHGFPEFWYEWKTQLAEFGKDHLAVAPDMRGYNLSDKPEALDQYRINVLVEDIRALADHFSHQKKFVLAAHDWGGAVAWAFAIQHPDMLDKLVIVNAPHPGVFGRLLASDAAQQQASQYMLMFRSPQAEQNLSANQYGLLVNAVLGAGLKNGVFTEEDKQAYIRAWSQPGALTGGLNYYRANEVGPPAAGQAASVTRGNFAIDPNNLMVKVPTLVIWGEKDTALLIQNLDGLDKFVPQLIVKRIPDGSHWVVHEKRDEVNAAIRDFTR
jgi:pimeloyl-ACP methyl ester carboxylesterase